VHVNVPKFHVDRGLYRLPWRSFAAMPTNNFVQPMLPCRLCVAREQDGTRSIDCRPDQRVMWSTSSTYHGLNLEASASQPRLQSSLLYILEEYDTSSSGIAGDTFGNSVSSPPVFDPRLRVGFPIRRAQYPGDQRSLDDSGPQSWSASRSGRLPVGRLVDLYVRRGLPLLRLSEAIPGSQAASTESFAFPNTVAGCNP